MQMLARQLDLPLACVSGCPMLVLAAPPILRCMLTPSFDPPLIHHCPLPPHPVTLPEHRIALLVRPHASRCVRRHRHVHRRTAPSHIRICSCLVRHRPSLSLSVNKVATLVYLLLFLHCQTFACPLSFGHRIAVQFVAASFHLLGPCSLVASTPPFVLCVFASSPPAGFPVTPSCRLFPCNDRLLYQSSWRWHAPLPPVPTLPHAAR